MRSYTLGYTLGGVYAPLLPRVIPTYPPWYIPHPSRYTLYTRPSRRSTPHCEQEQGLVTDRRFTVAGVTIPVSLLVVVDQRGDHEAQSPLVSPRVRRDVAQSGPSLPVPFHCWARSENC